MNDFAVTAVVLAAGFSERMGRFKPLLPLGKERIVDRVVHFFQAGGIDDILVVTGHRGSEVCRAVGARKVRCVTNPDYAQGMFSSILAGIRALPGNCRAFFIHPVDIPLVRPQTVRRLTAAFQDASADILYPTFDGRRGHPTLVGTGLAPGIRQWPGAGGLKAFLKRHDTESIELPVADEGVLLDLDTPADYSRMSARLIHADFPSEQECRVLMEEIQNLPDSIAVHSRAVSTVAQHLARVLKMAGVALDVELVRTAALLHDIARTRKKDHADIGARLLETHGFGRLAPIVRAHMDLVVNADSPIDEIQVVYLADKLVLGDRRVDLEGRFARQIKKFAATESIVTAIRRRKENARQIQAKVEQVTGRSIDALMGIPQRPDGEL